MVNSEIKTNIHIIFKENRLIIVINYTNFNLKNKYQSAPSELNQFNYSTLWN